MIIVDGKKYKVIEDLGFVHDRNQYAKAVQTEDGERIIVKDPGGPWEFSRPRVVVTSGRNPTGQKAEKE